MRRGFISKQWATDVYDYSTETVTDPAVDLDVQSGLWIACKWCNTKLKAKVPFNLTSWKTHLKSKRHKKYVEDAQTPSQVHNVSFSQSSQFTTSPSSLTSFSPIVRVESLQEEMQVVHSEIQQQKHKREELEQDVKDVIEAMTSLVAEQQNDIEKLQGQVNSMSRTIQTFRAEVEDLRHKLKETRISRAERAMPYSRSSTTCQRKTLPRTFSGKTRGGGKRKAFSQVDNGGDIIDNGVMDMDIFEKRFQLVDRT